MNVYIHAYMLCVRARSCVRVCACMCAPLGALGINFKNNLKNKKREVTKRVGRNQVLQPWREQVCEERSCSDVRRPPIMEYRS